MIRFRKFLRRSWAERLLLLEAALLVSLARLAVHTVPFRWLIRLAGKPQTETPSVADPQHTVQVQRVGWAVHAVVRHLPWECTCLAQALAARLLLARRGIAVTLYLGVRRDAHGAPSAHAWLRSGTLYVTGGPGHRQHQVIATFGGKTA
jgi:hypothetical protein